MSSWIESKSIDVVISTGGTGVTGRDGTPEAVEVLLDMGQIQMWQIIVDGHLYTGQ